MGEKKHCERADANVPHKALRNQTHPGVVPLKPCKGTRRKNSNETTKLRRLVRSE